MFNHNRGLWGYTGTAQDGEPLTIMSHGLGGPCAAIVLEELCDLGLERAVRVGSCGALDAGLGLGELVAATGVLATDGTSAALGAAGLLEPDPALTAALVEQADRAGTVASADLFYERGTERPDAWRAAGAIAVEMEAAALLAVAGHRGIPLGCVLMVSDAAPGAGERLAGEALEEAAIRLGRAGLAALAAAP
jgi:uridine phosphorylase